MKSQSAFVRSDGTVELNAVTGVYLYLSIIVYPRHTEFELALRIDKTL